VNELKEIYICSCGFRLKKAKKCNLKFLKVLSFELSKNFPEFKCNLVTARSGQTISN
jgi:hypothetical protein